MPLYNEENQIKRKSLMTGSENQRFLEEGRLEVKDRLARSSLFNPESFTKDLTDDDYMRLGKERIDKQTTSWGMAIPRAVGTIPLRVGEAVGGGVQRIGESWEKERQEIKDAIGLVQREGAPIPQPDREMPSIEAGKGFGTFLRSLAGRGVKEVGRGVRAIRETVPVKLAKEHIAKSRLDEARIYKEVSPEVAELFKKGDEESLVKASQLLQSEKHFAQKSFAEKVLSKPISEIGEATSKYLRETAEELRPVTEPGTLKYYVSTAIESVGSTMGPALIATLATKKPGIGLSIMFPQVYGQSYSEQRAEGKSVTESTDTALMYAITEVLSEGVPLGIITKVGGKFVPRVLKGATAESIQEGLNEAVQIAYDEGIIGEDTPPEEIGQRLLDAVIIGAIGGTGMGVISHGVARKETTDEEATTAKKDVMEVITDALKTKEQTPEQALNSIREGYESGLFDKADLDKVTKQYPNLKQGITEIVETAANQQAATNVHDFINEGMTEGSIMGEPFTPDTAFEIIDTAYTDKIITDEDIDLFKEQYPDLRSGLNDIIGKGVGETISQEIEDAERIRREVEEASIKERADREAEERIRIQRVKEDRLEAEKRETAKIERKEILERKFEKPIEPVEAKPKEPKIEKPVKEIEVKKVESKELTKKIEDRFKQLAYNPQTESSGMNLENFLISRGSKIKDRVFISDGIGRIDYTDSKGIDKYAYVRLIRYDIDGFVEDSIISIKKVPTEYIRSFFEKAEREQDSLDKITKKEREANKNDLLYWIPKVRERADKINKDLLQKYDGEFDKAYKDPKWMSVINLHEQAEEAVRKYKAGEDPLLLAKPTTPKPPKPTTPEAVEKEVKGKPIPEQGKIIEAKVKPGKKTIVYKNPTDSQAQELRNRFKEEYPEAMRGEPKTRSTYDAEGNEYRWMSGDATHPMIEGYIKDKFGIETNQSKVMLEPIPKKEIEAKPMPEVGEVSPILVEKQKVLEGKIESLKNRIDQAEKTAMPGTFVTGRENVPRSRIRKLEAQLDKRIDSAVEYEKLKKELTQIENQIKSQEEAPKRKLVEEKVKAKLEEQFNTIKVGDQIDVGGNNILTVTKKNPKSVLTEHGGKWTADEIIRVIPEVAPKKALPTELKFLAEKAQETSKKEFLDAFERGLNSQNLSKRETAQKTQAYMKLNMKMTPAEFYAEYGKKVEAIPKPKKEPKVEVPVEKEPWEMSKKEFTKLHSGEFDKRHPSLDKMKGEQAHAEHVMDAFLRNEKLPPGVLKEYEHLDMEVMKPLAKKTAEDIQKQREAKQRLKDAKNKREQEWDKYINADKYEKEKHHKIAYKQTLLEYLQIKNASDDTISKILNSNVSARGRRVNRETKATINVPESWYTPHYDAIKWAVDNKKTIPPEVLKDYPDLAEKPAEPTKQQPGMAWIKNKQRPIMSAREITRGKNKGKYEVILTKGRDKEGNIIPGVKRVVEGKAIITMPEAKPTKELIEEAKARIKASTTEILKGERGSFSTKTKEGAATFEDFSTVGKDFIQRGADTLAKFTEQMKKIFGEVWESVKHLAKEIYESAQRALRNERGLIGGIEAIGAPTGALSKAQDMLAEGKSKEEVWKDTGWLQGAEGEWKFEIDDSGARLLQDVSKKSHGDNTKLNKLLKHDSLFEAYPILKNMDVRFRSMRQEFGSLRKNPATGKSEIYLDPRGHAKAIENLFHEIQHAIQEIEGFARGGAPGSDIKTNKAFDRKALELNDAWVAMPKEVKLQLRKDYKEKFKGTAPSPINMYGDRYSEEHRDAVNDLFLLAPAKYKEDLIRILDEMENLYFEGTGLFQESDFQRYEKLAGEIEARDAAIRAKLTPEQRREQIPYEAEGIPEDQWIITKGDGTSFSVEEGKVFQTKPKRDYRELIKRYAEEKAKKAAETTQTTTKSPTGQKLTDELEKDRTYANKMHEERDEALFNVDRYASALERQVKALTKTGKKRGIVGRALSAEEMKFQEIEARKLAKAMFYYRESQINPEKGKAFEKYAVQELKTARGEKKIRLKEQLETYQQSQMLTNDQKKFVDVIINTAFGAVGKKAIDAGIITKTIDNYVRRIIKVPDNWAGSGKYGFKTFTTASMKRKAETIFDHFMEGRELKVSSIVNAYSEIASEVAVIVANKNFIKASMDIGVFTTDARKNGYAPLNAQGFSAWARKAGVKIKTTPEEPGFLQIDTHGRKIFFAPPSIKYGATEIETDRVAKYFETIEDAQDWVQEKGIDKYVVEKIQRADVFEKVTLYAPERIAMMLNKMTRTGSGIFEAPLMKGLLRFNAGIKGWILMSSFFHHMAGQRSWSFGVNQEIASGLKSGKIGQSTKSVGKMVDSVSAHKRGLEKIKAGNPSLSLLVKHGLTLGRMQDWDESLMREQGGVTETIARKLGAEKLVKGIEAIRVKRETFTNALFKRYFAGLKSEAAVIEFNLRVKKAIQRGETPNTDLIAEQTARLINADFGGLHLTRMGRSKDMQNMLRLLLLAPDWTESNFRTFTGMIPGANRIINQLIGDMPGPPGMEKVYRGFWGGVIIKATLATILVQAAASLWDDEEDKDWRKEEFFKNFKRLKWTGVNVSGIYRKMGIELDPNQRKIFSVVGHFADPLKIVHPEKLIKGKGSPLTRIAGAFMTKTDWRERPYTSFGELITTRKLKKKSRYEFKENFWEALPSIATDQVINMQPIQVGYLLRYLQGEEDGLSAGLSSMGFHITTAYKPSDKYEFADRRKKIRAKYQRYIDKGKKSEDHDKIRKLIMNYNSDRNKSKERKDIPTIGYDYLERYRRELD